MLILLSALTLPVLCLRDLCDVRRFERTGSAQGGGRELQTPTRDRGRPASVPTHGPGALSLLPPGRITLDDGAVARGQHGRHVGVG